MMEFTEPPRKSWWSWSIDDDGFAALLLGGVGGGAILFAWCLWG